MMLVVDISGSESFGSKNQFKKRYCYGDCNNGFSATQNNDKIGLILFSDQIVNSYIQKRTFACTAHYSRKLIEFHP
jgi:hypothetical protein